MFDSQLLLRDGTTTHLTATEAGTYVALPNMVHPMELRIVVPTMAETGDKIVATISYSANGTDAKEVVTLPDITYANVVTNKITEYAFPVQVDRGYIKLTLTVTDADTGSDFDAGHVWAGLVPAGRYNKKAYL